LNTYKNIIRNLLILILVSGFAFYVYALSRPVIYNADNGTLRIPHGASANLVAKQLEKQNCINNPWLFMISMKITFNERSIKPGRYSLNGIRNYTNLIQMITSQSSERIKVTILEGWNNSQIIDKLSKTLDLDPNKFNTLCCNVEFISSLDIKSPTLEGYLFPDTYILLTSYTEKDIVRLLVNHSKLNYRNHIDCRARKLGLTRNEVFTLASIIQGEAMLVSEMNIISSVYHNRLNSNMYLQADPTVQFAIPGKNRRLWNKDYKIDHRYNTYKYKGLPPGPINNPGLDALKAAVNPALTNHLYFVADGTGKHVFSNTNDEHNRAKNMVKRKRK
jgi:UPF0755 protein